MTRPVLIIANPVSGGGRGGRLAERLAAELTRVGLRPQTRLTALDHTGRQIAAEVEPGTLRCITVVGGDGSVHDVINGLRDHSPPLALLPAGTANVWAREARIPRDPAAVAEIIAAGRTVEAALGVANGAKFFLFVGAGLDARIVERVEAVRRKKGHLGGMSQWIVPGWSEFMQRPLADLTVTANGQEIRGVTHALVTRVRSYAGAMSMPHGIDIGDGILHVMAFTSRSKLGLIRLGALARLGKLRPGRGVTHLSTLGPVRIESAGGEEPYHIDGDHGGELPLEITLSDERIRLVVP